MSQLSIGIGIKLDIAKALAVEAVDAQLFDDLESWWALEEAAGAGARFDSHGLNDLTAVNTPGQGTLVVGNAVDLDIGALEYLSIVSNSSLQTGNVDHCFAGWVKPETTAVAGTILGKDGGGSAREYLLYLSAGVPIFALYDGDSTEVRRCTWGSALSDGTTHFIVASYDSVTGTASLNVDDGTPITDDTGGTPGVDTTVFEIGNRIGSSLQYDGLLDEWAYWKDYIPTAEEQTWLFNSGSGRSYVELLEYTGQTVYPLDGISNVNAAYSVRRLKTRYTGDLVRLRRDSDDAELDFGYNANGELDTAAISTWLTATTGYVVTWYDQSGLGEDATEATQSKQPLYVASGIGSKPSFNTVDATTNLRKSWSGGVITQPNSYLTVLNRATSGVNEYLFDSHGANRNVLTGDWWFAGAQNFYTDRGGVDDIFSMIFDGVSSELWAQGVSIDTGNTGVASTDGVIIFNRAAEDSAPTDAMMSEWIFYNGSIPVADHNTIGESMSAYFGISWTPVT